MARVFRLGISSLLLLLLGAPGHAQSPPSPSAPPIAQPVVGFVSPYEIMRTLRGAGFEPLSPPLREGTDYVLRANDFRGILMHVVVDARTGAIRDATRIVPGPGRYGQYYGAPAYGPNDFDAPLAAPTQASIEPPSMRPPTSRVMPDSSATLPPLPKPRPAALASRKSDSANQPPAPPPASIKSEPAVASPEPAVTPPPAGGVAVAKPAPTPDAKPQINSEVVTAPLPQTPAPAKKSAIPVEPLND